MEIQKVLASQTSSLSLRIPHWSKTPSFRFQVGGHKVSAIQREIFCAVDEGGSPGSDEPISTAFIKVQGLHSASNNEVSPDIKMGVPLLRSLQSLVGIEGFKSLLELESVKAILDREMLNPWSGTISFKLEFQVGSGPYVIII